VRNNILHLQDLLFIFLMIIYISAKNRRTPKISTFSYMHIKKYIELKYYHTTTYGSDRY
jgi:hypothetical protein